MVICEFEFIARTERYRRDAYLHPFLHQPVHICIDIQNINNNDT